MVGEGEGVVISEGKNITFTQPRVIFMFTQHTGTVEHITY